MCLTTGCCEPRSFLSQDWPARPIMIGSPSANHTTIAEHIPLLSLTLLSHSVLFPCMYLLSFSRYSEDASRGSLTRVWPPFASTLCSLLCCRRYVLSACALCYRMLLVVSCAHLHTLFSLVLSKHTTIHRSESRSARAPIALLSPEINLDRKRIENT